MSKWIIKLQVTLQDDSMLPFSRTQHLHTVKPNLGKIEHVLKWETIVVVLEIRNRKVDEK